MFPPDGGASRRWASVRHGATPPDLAIPCGLNWPHRLLRHGDIHLAGAGCIKNLLCHLVRRPTLQVPRTNGPDR
ncbi:MAG: hypothetical protein ABSE77_07525 [Acidimicrobiales bacterium]